MKTQELTQVLKALANARRLAILSYLKKKRSAKVGDIADHLKLSFKSTSTHLVVLRSAGIVDYRQSSLEMHYRIAPDISQETRTILSLI